MLKQPSQYFLSEIWRLILQRHHACTTYSRKAGQRPIWVEKGTFWIENTEGPLK